MAGLSRLRGPRPRTSQFVGGSVDWYRGQFNIASFGLNLVASLRPTGTQSTEYRHSSVERAATLRDVLKAAETLHDLQAAGTGQRHTGVLTRRGRLRVIRFAAAAFGRERAAMEPGSEQSSTVKRSPRALVGLEAYRREVRWPSVTLWCGLALELISEAPYDQVDVGAVPSVLGWANTVLEEAESWGAQHPQSSTESTSFTKRSMGKRQSQLDVLRSLALRASAASASDARAHYNLACLWARLDQASQAFDELRIALSLGPSLRMAAKDDPALRTLRAANHALWTELVGGDGVSSAGARSRWPWSLFGPKRTT